jgi:hypothetical protein
MLSPSDDLQFQDFGSGQEDKTISHVAHSDGPGSKTFHFSQPQNLEEADDGNEDEDTAKLLQQKSSMIKNFFTFDFYQQFFNVDTDQVVRRLINSLIPRVGKNYITQHLRPYPDLYGPFWISVTLIFATGIAGNLSKYTAAAGEDIAKNEWSYDFGIVTGAATSVLLYVTLVPMMLYGLFRWRRSQAEYSYLEMLAAYGYSLTAYVAASIICIIPFCWVQWSVFGLAGFLSGAVLVLTFWPAVRHDNKFAAFATIAVIFLLHILLAVELYIFFFGSMNAGSPSRGGAQIAAGAESTVMPPDSLSKSIDGMVRNASNAMGIPENMGPGLAASVSRAGSASVVGAGAGQSGLQVT